MNITLLDIAVADEALNYLMNKELPVKIAYQVQRLSKKLAPEIESYRDQYSKLVQKYGEREGEMWRVTPENVPKFNIEYSQLATVEVDVEVDTISLDTLIDALEKSELTIQPKFLNSFFISTEEESE